MQRLWLFALLTVMILAGCKSSRPVDESETPSPPAPAKPGQYTAVMQTDMGTITLELYPRQAPVTVANFVGLATGTQPWMNPLTMHVEHNKPFYDGLIFHRVIPHFMIQGGDPTGTGAGNPGYTFVNEVSPDLRFDRPGRLGMANSGPDTNGCQFFITVSPQPHLDGGYTVFGQVTSGQDVVDAISQVPRNENDRPLKPVHIVHVTITQKPE